MKAKNTNRNIVCKNCGHDHIGYVGDLGKDDDQEGYDRLPECGADECSCENWKGGNIKV